MSEDTIARLSAEEETALLKLAYSTHHSWLKHYDTLSVALVTLTSTIIFGFFGSNIERYKFANLEADPTAGPARNAGNSAVIPASF